MWQKSGMSRGPGNLSVGSERTGAQGSADTGSRADAACPQFPSAQSPRWAQSLLDTRDFQSHVCSHRVPKASSSPGTTDETRTAVNGAGGTLSSCVPVPVSSPSPSVSRANPSALHQSRGDTGPQRSPSPGPAGHQEQRTPVDGHPQQSDEPQSSSVRF